MNLNNFKKLIFITGAGRGIGHSIALGLAQQGYTIAGCSRTKSELERLEQEFLSLTKNKFQNTISTAVVDVRNYDEILNWFKETKLQNDVQPWGLVTAAGVYGPIGKFVENSLNDWKQALEINLMGTIQTVKIFCEVLLQHKYPGRIVLLSGGGATQPIPHFSSYCAVKSAVVRFGETIAQELEKNQITVNSIAPGMIDTKFVDDILATGPIGAGEVMYQKALEVRKTGGSGTDRARDLVTYLMSEPASEVTGRLISALWDPWSSLHQNFHKIKATDIYTLRRIIPEDRNL